MADKRLKERDKLQKNKKRRDLRPTSAVLGLETSLVVLNPYFKN
jgi:hypothetical protein